MQADSIAVMVNGMEILDVEDVGDCFYVAAEWPAGEGEGIVKALTLGCVDRIIDGVVSDRRRDAARDDAVQRARPGDGAELQLLE